MKSHLLLILLTVIAASAPHGAGAAAHCPASKVDGRDSPIRKWIRFHASYDDHIDARDSQSGPSATETTSHFSPRFTRGRIGSALQLGGPTAGPNPLTYPVEGRIDFSSTGSMSIWISPIAWSSGPGAAEYVPFVRIQGREATFLVERDRRLPGATSEKIIVGLFDTKGGPSHSLVVALDSLWSNGGWHLIVVNWDATGFSVSIDGRPEIRRALPVGALARALRSPNFDTSLLIGNKARDSTAIDDLTLYGVDLSPSEIEWLFRDPCS